VKGSPRTSRFDVENVVRSTRRGIQMPVVISL